MPVNTELTIWSFGCGLAPEGIAFNRYFGHGLKEFVGFDKNKALIREFRIRHQEYQKDRFQYLDLAQEFPDGF